MDIKEIIEILTKKFSNPELAEESDTIGMYESDRRIISYLKYLDKHINTLTYENQRMKDWIVNHIITPREGA